MVFSIQAGANDSEKEAFNCNYHFSDQEKKIGSLFCSSLDLPVEVTGTFNSQAS